MKNSRFFLKAMLLIATFALYSVKLLAQDKITFNWQVEAYEKARIQIDATGWFIVDWGNGTIEEWRYTIATYSHTYDSTGTYTVTVTAKDNCTFRTFASTWRKINDLTINNCSALEYVDLSYNQLQLSELHKFQFVYQRHLYSQHLPEQTAVVGEKLFADQSIFDGAYTKYTVTKFDGSEISAEDYSIVEGKLIFNTEGEYKVTMFNDSITSWDAKMHILWTDYVHISKITVNSLSAPNNKLSKFKIYPNPTTDFVYIKTEDDNIPEVKLYSTNGKLLQHVHNSKIDLSNYAKGLYVLSVNGNHMKIVKN